MRRFSQSHSRDGAEPTGDWHNRRNGREKRSFPEGLKPTLYLPKLDVRAEARTLQLKPLPFKIATPKVKMQSAQHQAKRAGGKKDDGPEDAGGQKAEDDSTAGNGQAREVFALAAKR
jgi:hypothetical protein